MSWEDTVVHWHVSDRGNGEPIVLLHGLAASSDSFAALSRQLEASFRVLSVDLPGHARSVVQDAVPTDDDGSVTWHARKVLDLLVERGLTRVVVVGHSFGGAVAAQIAALEPGRCAGLVLVSPMGVEGQRAWAFRALSALPAKGVLAHVAARPEGFLVRSLDRIAHTGLPTSRGTLSRVPPVHEIVTSVGRALQLLGTHEMIAADVSSALTQVALNRTPLLVIWGERDAVLPYGAVDRVRERCPDASFVIVGGGRHAPHQSHPEDVSFHIGDFAGTVFARKD